MDVYWLSNFFLQTLDNGGLGGIGGRSRVASSAAPRTRRGRRRDIVRKAAVVIGAGWFLTRNVIGRWPSQSVCRSVVKAVDLSQPNIRV